MATEAAAFTQPMAKKPKSSELAPTSNLVVATLLELMVARPGSGSIDHALAAAECLVERHLSDAPQGKSIISDEQVLTVYNFVHSVLAGSGYRLSERVRAAAIALRLM